MSAIACAVEILTSSFIHGEISDKEDEQQMEIACNEFDRRGFLSSRASLNNVFPNTEISEGTLETISATRAAVAALVRKTELVDESMTH